MVSNKQKQRTYAYIDASNLTYGGKGSLGWSIDYEKLIKYLRNKYGAVKVRYFGGVETYNYKFDYLANDCVNLSELYKYLNNYLKTNSKKLNEAELLLLGRHIERVKFYLKLKEFGYHLTLKPVKLYLQEDGSTKRKANCDVDMAFYIVTELEEYKDIVVLTGDGDFLPVLKYIKEKGKKVHILARGERAAKEIKQFAESDFRDFVRLRKQLEFKAQK